MTHLFYRPRGGTIVKLAQICALALLSALAAPVLAGDASGLDPAAIDQCVAAGESDCADAGMDACRAYAKEHYTGDDLDFVDLNCFDASHQSWEAKLDEVYDLLLKLEEAAGTKPHESLRQAENSWIGFREDLCSYVSQSAAARNNNAEVASLQCRRDEAARHWRLLNARLNAIQE